MEYANAFRKKKNKNISGSGQKMDLYFHLEQLKVDKIWERMIFKLNFSPWWPV